MTLFIYGFAVMAAIVVIGLAAFSTNRTVQQRILIQNNNTESPRRRRRKANENVAYESNQCVICFEPPSVILRPCGHVCLCESCANRSRKENFTRCPVCRDTIEEFGFKTC